MPKVSIIMPTYNGAHYISDAIESALNQTFKDFEIIIVDDGSTDNTKEIINRYLKIDNRISYCYKNNGGVASAYNFGIKKAKGEYLSYFEHDDISMPNRLEKQVEILDVNDEISLVYSSVQVFSNYESPEDIYAPYGKTKMSTKECFTALIAQGCCFNNQSVTLRKEITDYIMYDESLGNKGLGHDFLFFLEAAQKFIFYYIKEPLVYWRRGCDNLSTRYIDVFKADKAVIERLYKNKEQIFGITYKQALSMMYIRQARAAMFSTHLKNKYLIYLYCIFKGFLSNCLNLTVYKTIIWTFTKRLWTKHRRMVKIETPIISADYLLRFRK